MSKPGGKKQRSRLRHYIRQIANALELRDWAFTLSHDPPTDADAIACIECVYGRKHAVISVAARFWASAPEEQRQTIAHELIHCHLQPTVWNLNSLGSHVPVSTFDVLMGTHRDALEFATDALADAIAPHLPLPGEKAGTT